MHVDGGVSKMLEGFNILRFRFAGSLGVNDKEVPDFRVSCMLGV